HLYLGRDVHDLLVIDRDDVPELLVYVFFRVWRVHAERFLAEVQVVLLEQHHQIARRRGAVDRAVVTVGEQIWQEAHVVHVAVAYHDRVDVRELEARHVQVRVGLGRVSGGRVHAAIHDDLAMRRLHQQAGPAYLAEATEGHHADPVPW